MVDIDDQLLCRENGLVRVCVRADTGGASFVTTLAYRTVVNNASFVCVFPQWFPSRSFPREDPLIKNEAKD